MKATWFDLPAKNVADAMSFYEALFGWTFLRMADPAPDGYWVIREGETLIGGLRETVNPLAGQVEAEAPVIYFTVDKLFPVMHRAIELGAKLVGETVALGRGRGSYQWLRDREKNLIGLWSLE